MSAGKCRLHAAEPVQPFDPNGNSPPARGGIRGAIFAGGRTGWAVLCSVNHSTALLAFRNDTGTDPQTVTTSDDRGYLQWLKHGNVRYSREVAAVIREFIMNHCRGYGGPKPPPI